MAEYSRMASGSFTSTGATQFINLPFAPNRVNIFNYSAARSAPAANAVVAARWDASMGQGFAIETAAYATFGTTPTVVSLVADLVTSGGISTFSAGQLLQFGPRQQIVATTAANPIVFTVTAHGYKVGDVVIFEGLYNTGGTTGMPQISGMQFVISAIVDPNNFSVVWPGNNSNYTALTSSPTGAYVQKVLYPFLYAPGVATIGAITLGTTTTVVTTAPHNFVVGQEIAFRIPSAWGTVQLNSLPNQLIPGSPTYGYVTSVTNSTTFVCSINSSSYTAFTPNIAVSAVPGLTPAQVLAVGDVNTGGVAYSGGALYPSPVVNGVSTINGPAISGAFVNNTRQGFSIGTGAGSNLASSVLVGANGNLIKWEAFLDDLTQYL